MIGCSGTGSPVIEQLARLGVGELVLADDNKLEARNINRILNAIMEDVRAKQIKVDVLAGAVQRMETGTCVVPLSLSLWRPEAVKAVARYGLVFGCMGTIDGRFLLNTIVAYYQRPKMILQTPGHLYAPIYLFLCVLGTDRSAGGSSRISTTWLRMRPLASRVSIRTPAWT